MEYFELFGLKPHFDVDLSALKKKYYGLSKHNHPDFHTLSSSEIQADALEKSTLINLAYKTLSNEKKLLKYILSEHKLIQEEQGNQIPQDFLMEMMDINEAIMDLEFDPDEDKLEIVKKQFATLLDEEKTQGQEYKEAYNKGIDDNLLNQLKDHYFKMKYLDRISENLISK